MVATFKQRLQVPGANQVHARLPGRATLQVYSGVRKQAMAELRKLKQGKLSIERHIEKYQSLVNRSPMVGAEFHYNWFIAGLSPGVRQTVIGGATDREMRDEQVQLADMMEYLCRMERKDATSTALAEKEKRVPGNEPDLEPMDIGAVNTKPAKDGAIGGYRQDLMALLDTGCEVDMIPEAIARRCSLPVYSLAQSRRLRVADGRQDTRIGKTMCAKCSISSKTGHIPMTRDFYVRPVHHDIILGMPWVTQWKAQMRSSHHDIILGMPWVTQWKAQMRSSDAAIEVTPPESDERAPLSALPTAFASSMVRCVETVSKEKGSDEAPAQCRGTEENNGDMHSLRRDCLVNTAVLWE
ncbi:LOW QUALITY PROTEIN: uncharacterized protein EMH_0028290 [Eimeria mitis]|uniref:Uncharacterized protein n=1 Tax=Eimeria mitis TaxID=44415 RepID=U6KFU0_9EIME|nr:LOW QUALITY PROTEIN: uncharacterized protein EMH_0028290 [Eimeria mitis]CDJ35656.1 hypothetical protein EMH_0028290 [Eimeria mitis]